jgi:hypothetical protein
MIRALLVLMVGLTFSCSGFNKPLHREVPTGFSGEFLYWCKQKGVWPVYIKRPDCPEVSRGKWDHYPLIVTSQDEFVTETLEAIEAFNAQVGFPLFQYSYTSLKADVGVVDGGWRPFLYAVAKHLSLPGQEQYGEVRMYNELGKFDRADVVMHELGHIVGLRHDRENPLSLMFHTDGSNVMSLERQDVIALRKIYLGE